MARNVDDLMLSLEVLWNNDQSYSENPPIALKQYQYEGKKLNIAYSETLDNLELDEEYNAVYQRFLNKIRLTRHNLHQAQPTYNTTTLTKLWGKIAGFDFGAALNKMPLKGFISYLFIKLKYKDNVWAEGMRQGAQSNSNAYAKALQDKEDVSDVFFNFFKDHDIWITPVSLAPAFKHQKTGQPFKINGEKVPYTKAFIPFNFPSTIPGHPIAVIPIGKTKSGLPVGVQIHGQKWQDYKLLQMTKELEQLCKGFQIPKMFNL